MNWKSSHIQTKKHKHFVLPHKVSVIVNGTENETVIKVNNLLNQIHTSSNRHHDQVNLHLIWIFKFAHAKNTKSEQWWNRFIEFYMTAKMMYFSCLPLISEHRRYILSIWRSAFVTLSFSIIRNSLSLTRFTKRIVFIITISVFAWNRAAVHQILERLDAYFFSFDLSTYSLWNTQNQNPNLFIRWYRFSLSLNPKTW